MSLRKSAAPSLHFSPFLPDPQVSVTLSLVVETRTEISDARTNGNSGVSSGRFHKITTVTDTRDEHNRGSGFRVPP